MENALYKRRHEQLDRYMGSGTAGVACVRMGRAFVGTGTLKSGTRKMQRSEAQAIVQALGGNIVTGEYGKLRNANLLILSTQAGNRTQSQKMDAARDSNIPTITAEQFFSMIG